MKLADTGKELKTIRYLKAVLIDCRKGKMFTKSKFISNTYHCDICNAEFPITHYELALQHANIEEKKYQDKLHRRNMQIKNLQKKAGDALSWLNDDAFGKIKISNAKEILATISR